MATTTSCDTLPQIFDFSASAAPFLCLILDHLLCPDSREAVEEMERDFGVMRMVERIGGRRSFEGPATGWTLCQSRMGALMAVLGKRRVC